MDVCIKYEDCLDGISNYFQWKFKMSAILSENKIWRFVSTIVVVPSTDYVALYLHEVKEAKYHRLILDGVKDHLILHLAKKKTVKEMWDALKNLYEVKNENQKMALKDKLHDTNMGKGEIVWSYLAQVSQVKGEMAIAREVIMDLKLVRISLKGFTKEWEIFVKYVVGCEHLPDWSILWDGFT
jgi:hypothetical protein